MLSSKWMSIFCSSTDQITQTQTNIMSIGLYTMPGRMHEGLGQAVYQGQEGLTWYRFNAQMNLHHLYYE